MKKIIRYTNDYKTIWSKYVDNSPNATIAHHIGWLNVMKEGLGHKPRYLLTIEENRIKGILPLVIVKTWWQSCYLISLPWIDYGGVCTDDYDTEKMLLDEAKRITESEKAQFMELRSVKAGDQNLATR